MAYSITVDGRSTRIIGEPEFGPHGVAVTVSAYVCSTQGSGYVETRRFYPYASFDFITFPEED